MTTQIEAIKKQNWKNRVRFYFEGNTLSELKLAIKLAKEMEDKSHYDFLIRNTNEFRDALTNLLY